MFATGMGCGFLMPSTTSGVVVWFPAKERATVLGLKQTAVNMAQTELPDLILMNIRLPGGINGLEATRRIKALPQLAHIPILAMTASVRSEDM